MEFDVYAALHEETDKGWVWFLDPNLTSRMTVTIVNGHKTLYCEYREIDENFLTLYNERSHTRKIDPEGTWAEAHQKHDLHKLNNPRKFQNILVISGWYRDALGIGEKAQSCNLDIKRPRCSAWADLRAACQHPEPGVRVATRVGLLGTWLGVLGLSAFVDALKQPPGQLLTCSSLSTVGVAVAFAIMCVIAGKGVKPRR